MSFKNHVTYELKKDVLHMSYGRTCYVTYELRKDMLQMRTKDDSLTNKAFISIDICFFGNLCQGLG